MKFIYADCLDMVDPNFDFVDDRHAPDRKPYWGDQYTHEILGYPPYDGILVSRAVVGDGTVSGKYTQSQSMRFRRVGARKFLRLDGPEYKDMPIFGDCGAFSYHKYETPPYTAQDTVDFYEEAGFTHGCSIDHIIFDFDETSGGLSGGSPDAHRRFEITEQLATEFLKESKRLGKSFTPMGVVQGWSPGSMAVAAGRLEKMGYDYLAVGGLVPLGYMQIHEALQEIRSALSSKVKLHLLGFAKPDNIHEFLNYGVASFDSTSPMLRAFKDAKSGFFTLTEKNEIGYYTSIRIPQALENRQLGYSVQEGLFRQEDLQEMERSALQNIRDYASGHCDLEKTMGSLLKYTEAFLRAKKTSDASLLKQLSTFDKTYRRTLTERPWEQCDNALCRGQSIEAVIFRANNRNRRRGMHNLSIFYKRLNHIRELNSDENDHVYCYSGAAE
jgi:hypothetical protein